MALTQEQRDKLIQAGIKDGKAGKSVYRKDSPSTPVVKLGTREDLRVFGDQTMQEMPAK